MASREVKTWTTLRYKAFCTRCAFLASPCLWCYLQAEDNVVFTATSAVVVHTVKIPDQSTRQELCRWVLCLSHTYKGNMTPSHIMCASPTSRSSIYFNFSQSNVFIFILHLSPYILQHPWTQLSKSLLGCWDHSWPCTAPQNIYWDDTIRWAICTDGWSLNQHWRPTTQWETINCCNRDFQKGFESWVWRWCRRTACDGDLWYIFNHQYHLIKSSAHVCIIWSYWETIWR